MQRTCYKGIASILALITDAEVAKTITSFLAWEDLGSYLHNGLSYYSSSKWPEQGPIGFVSFF